MVVTTGVETLDILITGLPATGKSSFVTTICDHSGMGQGTMAGWQLGRLSVDTELQVKFLEPPAMQQFDFIWLRDLISRADVPGFIVVCDSTQPESFGEMIGILETIRALHPQTPCVLATNKQDVPGAWGAEDIRVGLGIPNSILVMPCIAHDRNAVKDVVVQLLYQIIE